MEYKPRPINTSDVNLTRSLQTLIEELAKNTHDIWSRQRLAEGWLYGPKRNDDKKTHPCLIDYDDLPESEKKYDRDTASEALKSVIKLGFRILDPVKAEKAETTEDLISLANRLREPDVMATNELISLWLGHEPGRWSGIPEIYLLLGKSILKKGDALLAYDILTKGLDVFQGVISIDQVSKRLRPLYLSMRQQQALALAQSGALSQAMENLVDLKNQGVRDGETLGILGRVLKDMAMLSGGRKTPSNYLKESFKIYHEAYAAAIKSRKSDDAYYNGINAATLALLNGQQQVCRDLADNVKQICLRKIRRDSKNEKPTSYWLYATLGEAELLLGNLEKADKWYQKAGLLGRNNFRDLASMRKQARLVLDQLGHDPLCFDHCFNIPSVAIFSGHMIDQPGRQQERFPAELEPTVRKEIVDSLNELNAGVGYSSAACGSDIIFLEEMLKRGSEINIVLPFEKEKFIEQSVDVILGANWGKRFDRLIKKAARVIILCQYNPLMNKPNLEFTNLFMYGKAMSRSQTMGTNLESVAVWNGRPGDGPGGTAALVRYWKKQKQVFNHIDLRTMLDDRQTSKPLNTIKKQKTPKRLPRKVKHHQYKAMMFADVKGYSTLKDDQLVNFSIHFLKCIGDLTAKYEEPILSKRTQGDSVFLVFNEVTAAADLAIEFRDKINRMDWTRHDLPEELTARIALDAGPCYSYDDPVVGRREFCGAYVNRAARIEPITPPGHIYASESYVALARTMGINQFQFDYVGQVILPKNHGTIPAYHVSGRNTIEP